MNHRIASGLKGAALVAGTAIVMTVSRGDAKQEVPPGSPPIDYWTPFMLQCSPGTLRSVVVEMTGNRTGLIWTTEGDSDGMFNARCVILPVE